MKLNVNPNRMELLRLRRRLVLAERGHKLLKDKLEELMRRFLDMIKELSSLQERLTPVLNQIFISLAMAQAPATFKETEELIPEGDLSLKTREEKVFSLIIPRMKLRNLRFSDYDLRRTSAELDIGLKKTREILDDLTEMVRLYKAVELLAEEIESTRRRVNALEHILIPSLKETIRAIAGRLEEMERSYQVQLMRVKEIVRKE
ncbi:MAG: V-type ATP synthase subunit D [Acidobacteriota bacterium]